MLQCQQHLLRVFCIAANIRDDQSQGVFFAQMTSCATRYIIIYHPFRINSQYLKMLGVDSPAHSSSAFLKNYISNDIAGY